MVHFLSIVLASLISLSAFAGVNPSGVPLLPLGGAAASGQGVVESSSYSLSTTGNWFTITAGTSNSAANFCYPFTKAGAGTVGGSVYQVSSGKTAYCTSLTAMGASAVFYQLMSATTACAANGTTAGSIAGGVFETTAVSLYAHMTHGTAGTPVTENMVYTFGQNSFPAIQSANASQVFVRMLCKEI